LCLACSGIVPQYFGGRFFGRAEVSGLDTLQHPIHELARVVGSVFEDPEAQLVANSVENEVAFALENLAVPREVILARIPRVLEAVRLEGTAHRHPSELSGGQKQRLAIAAALAVEPDLLVLDEPTSQLDPVGAQEVFATVRELNRELGITILMASHASEELAEHADRIAHLHSGELLAIGDPDSIYAQVELLERTALRPPQVATTLHMARQRGISVPQLPVRLQEGLDLLEAKRTLYHIVPPPLTEAAAIGGQPLLAVRDLCFTYPDGTHALSGVSLDIRRGEYVLIVGQNGAGKSTLVKHFVGLLRPESGEVTLAGQDTARLRTSQLARQIGYIAQNPDNQIFNSTVEDEVSFALRHLGLPSSEVEARTLQSLTEMGLGESREQHPLSLPKGDRARIVIAAILALRPEIIIFDEPTTGQDYQGARSILELTRQLHGMGKTIIVITHHLYLMPEYAKRVIVMGRGNILLDAPIREAYHNEELLRSTYLTPPQAVLLAKALARISGQKLDLLTPREVADSMYPIPQDGCPEAAP